MTATERERQPELREISREECIDLLASHHIGRLATVIHGSPVIRPVNYVFDPASQSVLFRTGRGSKLHALQHASKAVFEIDGFDEGARTGWSVIVQGTTAEVSDPSDVRRLHELGLCPWVPVSLPHWVRIRARALSGRRIVDAAG